MIEPKGKLIVVRPDKVEDKYESGLHRPVKSVPNTGVVVAVSPDYEFDMKVGQRVRYLPNHQEILENGDVLIRGDEEGVVLFIFND